ncbi:MAG: biotin/lipoyl-containing protein [Thermomicrobiales bacterium]
MRFPKLGASEGQVLRWFVKEGDTVMRDQLVAEIETEKVIGLIPIPDELFTILLNGSAGFPACDPGSVPQESVLRS